MGGQSHSVFTFQEKLAIINDQRYKCAYCGIQFDTSQLGTLAIQFDHFIPRSKGGPSSKQNMSIAACAKCNNIKSNKVFDSIRDVRLYIRGSLNLSPYDPETETIEPIVDPAQEERLLRVQAANELLEKLYGA